MANILKEIFKDYQNDGKILNAIIDNINLYKKSNKLEIILKSEEKISLNELASFEHYLKERFKIGAVDIKINYSIKIENTINEDWESIVKYLSQKFPLIRPILGNSIVSVEDRKILISLNSKNADFLHSYEVDKEIAILVQNLYGASCKVEYRENINEETKHQQEEFLEKLQKDACKNLIKETAEMKQKEEQQRKEQKMLQAEETGEEEEEYTPLILGRSPNIKEQVVKILDLTADYGRVALEGKVISTDSRELKNGKTLVMFNLYDGTSTITCKSFVEPEKVSKVMSRIKSSGRLKIQGNAAYDNFAKELGVIANVIIEVPAISETARVDRREEKRVELHLHTQMSQMDAITSATDLIKRAASWGMKSIAITDHGVVQAFPEANKAAAGLDIKVIYGVEAYLVPDEEIPEGVEDGFKKVRPYHAIILTQNYKGLRNLYELISVSHLNYYHKRPRVLKSVFDKYREGLILGSACEQGEVYKAILNNKPEEEIERIASYYDYLEIQPLGNNEFMVRDGTVESKEDLININRKIVALGDKLGKLTVATCDVHFMDPQDEVYRRILMAGQGFSDADNQAPLYLRTTEEMLNEFVYLGNERAYEVVVTNTNKIADMCEAICPISKDKCPPVMEGAEEEIEKICTTKAEELYGNPLPQIVQDR